MRLQRIGLEDLDAWSRVSFVNNPEGRSKLDKVYYAPPIRKVNGNNHFALAFQSLLRLILKRCTMLHRCRRSLSYWLPLTIMCLQALAAQAQTIPFELSSRPTPIKVCVVQDKTGSSAHYGTPQVSESDLTLLTDHLIEASGELGVGFLDEASNWPLTRMYVPLLADQPVRQKTANPRKQLQNEIAYRKDLDDWVLMRDRRIQRAEDNTKMFFDSLHADLVRPPNAGQSDVAGSIVRCDRFLAEPTREWEGKTVLRSLVMISDAEHAVTAQSRAANDRIHAALPDNLESKPIIYVVNGEKHKGDLAGKYSVIAVESIRAAFRDIISRSNQGR